MNALEPGSLSILHGLPPPLELVQEPLLRAHGRETPRLVESLVLWKAHESGKQGGSSSIRTDSKTTLGIGRLHDLLGHYLYGAHNERLNMGTGSDVSKSSEDAVEQRDAQQAALLRQSHIALEYKRRTYAGRTVYDSEEGQWEKQDMVYVKGVVQYGNGEMRQKGTD